MKRILILAALCAAFSAHAIVPCNHTDKTVTLRHGEHLAVSAVMATAGTYYTKSKWEGFGISFGIGLLKEIRDSQDPNDAFTCKSLVADAIGAALGAEIGGAVVQYRDKGVQVSWSSAF